MSNLLATLCAVAAGTLQRVEPSFYYKPVVGRVNKAKKKRRKQAQASKRRNRA